MNKTEKQIELDKRYLKMATIWSENSYCVRRQVGALIVKDNRIISDGYNGTPKGFPNVCEFIPNMPHVIHHDDIVYAHKHDYTLKTHDYVLHAEANAITKLAKCSVSGEGATLYVTTSPCIECAKLIIQTGIIRVVYCDEYHTSNGIELLKQANIEIIKL